MPIAENPVLLQSGNKNVFRKRLYDAEARVAPTAGKFWALSADHVTRITDIYRDDLDDFALCHWNAPAAEVFEEDYAGRIVIEAVADLPEDLRHEHDQIVDLA